MTDIIRITRQELYKKVWEIPTTTLAKEYGISDSAIVKICRRHNIPKPGLGDWTCMRRGIHVEKAILPNPDSNPEICINSQLPTLIRKDAPFTNIFKRALAYEASASRIEVGNNRTQNPFIKDSRQYLRAGKPNEVGRVEPRKDECLNILVSPASINRALNIMDALINALDNRGMNIALILDGKEGTFVNICGEFVSIRMLEMLLITPKEKGERKPKYYDYKPCTLSDWQATTRPSGRLVLSLDTLRYTGGTMLRKNWRDGSKQKIEDSLNEVIIALIKAAYAQRIQRTNWTESSAKRDAESQKGKIREILDKQIKEKDAKLFSAIENWEESLRIRAFVAEAGKISVQRGLPNEQLNLVNRWITWASQKADNLDPFSTVNIGKLGNAANDTEGYTYLRTAVPNDDENINKLLGKAFVRSVTTENEVGQLLSDIRKNDLFDSELSIVAMHNTELIGYILLCNVGIKNRPGVCGVAVTVLYIDPVFQRKGVGTFLMTTIIKRSRELHKAFIVAPGCSAFFLKSGFTFIQNQKPTNEPARKLVKLIISSDCGDISADNIDFPEGLQLLPYWLQQSVAT